MQSVEVEKSLRIEARLRESYRFLQGRLQKEDRALRELDTIWMEVLQYIDLLKGKVLPD